MLKFKTSCAVLAYLSSNLLNEVGLSVFRYFEVGLRVCDIVVNKFTFAISSPDEFLLAKVNVYVTFAICHRRSVCRLSVCLSVYNVGAPYSAGCNFRQFFLTVSPGTLVFWCQKLLVGDAPFRLKFAFKVTHPLSNSEISTNIGSKRLNRDS